MKDIATNKSKENDLKILEQALALEIEATDDIRNSMIS